MMAEVHQPSNELSSSNEEVEEDIANNNDPNNNAPNLDVDEVLRVEEDICDILEGTIDDETSNILKLFPGAEREDIRQRLENNWTNPLRQQVVTNELIDKTVSNYENEFEQKADEPTSSKLAIDPKVTMDSSNQKSAVTMLGNLNETNEYSRIKNKTGNGLKSKNSNRRQDIRQSGPPMDLLTPKRLRLDVPNHEVMEGSSLMASHLEEDMKAFASCNVPFENNTSALSSSNSSASSSSSSSPILPLESPWQLGQLAQSSFKSEASEKIVPPIVDLATPEVITVDETPSPITQEKDNPVLVDISQADQLEIQMLFKQFCDMFPDTPKLYLEQQAADLVGKHAAINRFIDELFENDSKPPEYWKPDVLTVPLTANSSKSITYDNNRSEPLDLLTVPNPGDKQYENSYDITAAKVEANYPADNLPFSLPSQNELLQPQASCSTSNEPSLNISDNKNAPNEMETLSEPIPGPSGTQKRSAPSENLNHNPISTPDTSNNSVEVTDTEEEKREQEMDKRVQNLLSLFPQKDPEYLRTKNNEFGLDLAGVTAFEAWVLEVVENGGKDLPSREDYDKRKKEEKVLEKYSGQVTVEEVLKWYGGDPEAYFSDLTRVVDELYKKHCLAQLKKEFRTTTVATIDKVIKKHNSLYVPSYRALVQHQALKDKRKTKRPDHECGHPKEISLNFLKELQYSKIDQQVIKHIEDQKIKKTKLVEEARNNNMLQECGCCYNDECLLEDMFSCKDGHNFCQDCIQRASEVAMGDGKITLQCLGSCEANFDITELQKALKPEFFSKWFRKIQMAEIGEAGLQGLEECPFCQYTTIMDTTPEENKIFQCLHPDCGIESCRLCHEMSHIPLRCDEVEKDAEVRKRTYIENKMTEALVRKCWKCHKPFIKIDGCNKMTCECGAQMCYLCRQPVHNGYNHFYGQGGSPKPGRMCPLFTNNSEIHDSDVARGAKEAKEKMDSENPSVSLKYDPTEGIKMPNEVANQAEQKVDGLLDGLLPADPRERERFLQQQQQMLDNIRRPNHPNPNMGNPHPPRLGHLNVNNQGNPNERAVHGLNMPDLWDAGQAHHNGARNRNAARDAGNGVNPYMAFPQMPNIQPQAPFPQIPPQPHAGIALGNPNLYQGGFNGFVDQMGELLQLREAQRRRQRDIRRREQQALEAFQINRIAANNEANQPQARIPVVVNQFPPQNRHQNVTNNLNANEHAKRMRANLPGTNGATNHPQNINNMHNNGHQTNATFKPNPIHAAPTFNLQDHHYAYHQKIHRHLNPMPNPLQPPPNAGGYMVNGPPPPAHTAVPRTVDLAPIVPAQNPMFSPMSSLLKSQPLPSHHQQAQKPGTSKVTSSAATIVTNPETNLIHNPHLQGAKNIQANQGIPSTSGIRHNNSGNDKNQLPHPLNTQRISTTPQPLSRSKSTSS